MTGQVLIDTGPIVAILSESDEHHATCVKLLPDIASPLLTCWPVITEAAWLLRRQPGVVVKLLSCCNGQPFQLLPLNGSDLQEIAAVLTRYRNLGIQLADAALVHLAGRERIETIFTLDRRDFGALRLRGGRRFRLLP